MPHPSQSPATMEPLPLHHPAARWSDLTVHKTMTCENHPYLRWVSKGAGRILHFTGQSEHPAALAAWERASTERPDEFVGGPLSECRCDAAHLRVIELG
jgi:hypothetical protein